MTNEQAHAKALRIARQTNDTAIVVWEETEFDRIRNAVSIATFLRDQDCGQFYTAIYEVNP